MKNLYYNGESLLEKGLALKNYPKYNIAQRDLSFNSVVARSGDVIVDNKRYKNVETTYPINSIPYLVTAETSYGIVRELTDWLMPTNGDYKILRDDYNPGYFCEAFCTEIGEISNPLAKYIDTTITFNRKPFWYSDLGQKTITLAKVGVNFEINNPEKYTAEPLIRVYGTGNITLTINDVNYNVTIPSSYGYIDLDSELQTASVKAVNFNKNIDFDYMPTLIPGENYIKATPYQGSTEAIFEKIEIIPRWRRL